MTTAIILIVILGGGAVWLYRLGRMSKEVDRLKGFKKVTGNINEFNRKEDKATGEHMANISITSPWLRKRK